MPSVGTGAGLEGEVAGDDADRLDPGLDAGPGQAVATGSDDGMVGAGSTVGPGVATSWARLDTASATPMGRTEDVEAGAGDGDAPACSTAVSARATKATAPMANRIANPRTTIRDMSRPVPWPSDPDDDTGGGTRRTADVSGWSAGGIWRASSGAFRSPRPDHEGGADTR
jgi:hypothetical protein